MFVETIKSGSCHSVLLRESYRKDGKVLHRTIGNLTGKPQFEIDAINYALKHKKALSRIPGVSSAPQPVGAPLERQGKSAGAVCAILQVADELGIVDALGDSRHGKLALWQVVARVIDQGSRLSAVRLAETHAACDTLDLEEFNEDSLYENLKWVAESQERVEDELFARLWPDGSPPLYLYDVTSSYLEGDQNFFAMFGYNRDGKKGKMQIVVGLLCDPEGRPLSIEVFPGSTGDTTTVKSQLEKISTRFGGKEIIFVGDRGMIKSKQILDLTGRKYKYITGITHPQIEKLLEDKVLDMSLFDQELAEVESVDGVRYVLRCNPIRAEDTAQNRDERIDQIVKAASRQTVYLKEHPKATPVKAVARVMAKASRLKVGKLVVASATERTVIVKRDEDAIAELAKLDGCYVLKTDVSPAMASKEIIHSRYKDLAKVEWAFRTSKTGQLEMRPVFVRTEESTRGHVFIVMLAYRITQELAKRWKDVDMTVEEAVEALDTLCLMEIHIGGMAVSQRFPEPRHDISRLLDAARIRLPAFLPISNVNVSTRKKISERRDLRRKRKNATHK